MTGVGLRGLMASYLHMCASVISSIIWYRPRGVNSSAGKVTVGRVKSTTGFMTKSPAGSALCPTLVIEYGSALGLRGDFSLSKNYRNLTKIVNTCSWVVYKG